MACDVTTLENAAYANGLPKLSEHDTLICLASIFGTQAGFANAQAALNAAYAHGLTKLSEADLWRAFEAAICH